jgi:hypothetical protein
VLSCQVALCQIPELEVPFDLELEYPHLHWHPCWWRSCSQRFKLLYETLLSSFVFESNLRLYTTVISRDAGQAGKGLHSSTFWLNLSAFCGIQGAFGGHLGVVQQVSGDILRAHFASKTAQVELKSGRV